MLESEALKVSRFRKLAAWYLYQRKDLLHASCIHGTTAQELKTVRALDFNQAG